MCCINMVSYLEVVKSTEFGFQLDCLHAVIHSDIFDIGVLNQVLGVTINIDANTELVVSTL